MPRHVLTANARTILEKRYLEPGETIDGMFQRVSGDNEKFLQLMSRLDFLPNSPSLMNKGTGRGTSSACFVFDVRDAMLDGNDSIMGTGQKAAAVAKWGGGVGYYLGNIRPQGSPVRSTHRVACGPVAVLRYYNEIGKLITQGGRRELAQMGVLPCTHPDIRHFIHCKDKDPQSLRTFNISVSITDDFMNRSEVTGSHEQELWNEIVDSAWKTGDPGVLFIDAVNRANPTPHLGDINATNPCGEQPLLGSTGGEACNLGSINLANFVTSDRIVDWIRLGGVTETSIRFLDHILDCNQFPHPDITHAVSLTRKIGLGVMGWADMLALLHVHYDTNEAIALAEHVMKFINDKSREMSICLAGEKNGPYPASKGDPCHHAVRTNVAPTGTISIIAGCSSGIEPHFALAWDRTINAGSEGHREEIMQEKIPVMDELDGFIPHIANEISWEWHVRHQAAFQKHLDQACSKCVIGDTLVLTSAGLRRIDALHDERGDDVFIEDWSMPVAGEYRLTTARGFYSGGLRDTVRFTTRQGSSLEGTPNHRVRVEVAGSIVWRRLDALRVGDLIVIRSGQRLYADKQLVSTDVACLLGHLIADGSIMDNWVALCHMDPEVNAERERLLHAPEIRELVLSGRNTRHTSRLPHYKPDYRKPRLVTVQQNSMALVRWLEQEIGMRRRAAFKVVPACILGSNWEVQRAFLRGLFTDCGVANRETPNLSFNTASHVLARQVKAMLANADWYTSLHTRTVNDVDYYRLHFQRDAAIGFAAEVGFTEPARRAQFDAWQGHCPKSRYNGGTLLKRRDGYLVEPVTEIVTGRAAVFDISVPDEHHAFITEGMVSHNTINLPHAATRADIAGAYREMWRLGCKGGTVFRDGCRSGGEQVLKATDKPHVNKVLSNGQSKPLTATAMAEYINHLPANDLEAFVGHIDNKAKATLVKKLLKAWQGDALLVELGHDRIRRKLPSERQSITHKMHIGQFEGYITVGLYEDGTPGEIFFKASKEGSTVSGLMDAWAMAVSVALQYGAPLDTLVRLHTGMRFEPYGITRSKDLPVCSSIADYVFRWLSGKFSQPCERKEISTDCYSGNGSGRGGLVLQAVATVVKQAVPIGSGLFCPDCEAEAIYDSGCLKCPNAVCAWARCG